MMDGFVEGFILGAVVVVIILGFALELSPDRFLDLGQAICEERYDMDYDWYDGSNKELHCKPKAEPYDGIKVRVGGDHDE